MVCSGTFPPLCAAALLSLSAVHVASAEKFGAFDVFGDAKQTGVTYIFYNSGASEGTSGNWGDSNYRFHPYYGKGARQVVGLKGQEYACVEASNKTAYTFIGRVSFHIVMKNNQTEWVGPYGNQPEEFAPVLCDHLNATDFEYTDITQLSFVSHINLIDDIPEAVASIGPFNGLGKAVHGSGGAGSTKKPEKKHSSTTTILLATLLCLSCVAIVVLSVYLLLMHRRRDAGGNETAHEAEGDSSASDGGHQPLNYGGAEGGDDQEEHRAELERMEAEHAERVRLLKAQAEVSS